MKIWVQLVASSGRLPRFLQVVQAQCDTAANPGTQVTVSGSPHGALGDQHAAFLHFDAHDILRLMHERVRGHGYDVYAMGNSLDPAVDALREILDIPVVSSLHAGCSIALTLGDRIGIVATNPKFGLIYRRLLDGYGLGPKLGGVGALEVIRPADLDAGFDDVAAALQIIEHVDSVAKELVAKGAEVLIVPGPIGSVLAKGGVTQMRGATVIDLYASLVKVSEAMGYLSAHCGMKPSRLGRYQAPSKEAYQEAIRVYGLNGPGH